MADIAGLAISIVTLLDTCITATRLISTAKNFPSESDIVRIGLLIEGARLRSWAKAWGIGIENGDGKDGVSRMPANRTKLLMEEAERYCLDLPLVQQILRSALDLLSEGQDRQTRHEPKEFEKVSYLHNQSLAI
jgi:hypothetical protein